MAVHRVCIVAWSRGIVAGGHNRPTADDGAPQSRWVLLCAGGGARVLRRAIMLAAGAVGVSMFAIRRKGRLWATP